MANGRKRLDKHHWWRGGTSQLVSGYVEAKLSPDDPYISMAGRYRYVREHRLVMARHLDRCLEPHEVVHHINGVRNDNRIDNLELFSSSEEHHKATLNVRGFVVRSLEVKVVELERRIAELEYLLEIKNS